MPLGALVLGARERDAFFELLRDLGFLPFEPLPFLPLPLPLLSPPRSNRSKAESNNDVPGPASSLSFSSFSFSFSTTFSAVFGLDSFKSLYIFFVLSCISSRLLSIFSKTSCLLKTLSCASSVLFGLAAFSVTPAANGV